MLPHEKQIEELEELINKMKSSPKEKGLWSNEELASMEKKLSHLKKKVYADLKPWDRVLISRHPDRPHSIDYIKNICDSFEELHGDRTFGDDAAVIGGLATINGEKFVVIGQEKGHDTESRIKRNFGMMHPEGYRKALRLMKLAEKFKIPVLTLLDTPGAYPGLSAEERGQGWAIAQNLFEMARIKTPIFVLLIGEGCSGGALGLGVGDVIAMLEHSYYSVISPEGCASILFKDAHKKEESAIALKMQSEDLQKLGVVDAVIKEPQGGAHINPAEVYKNVKKFILEQLAFHRDIPPLLLIEKRYKKFREMGQFSVDPKI